ncbi:hypothetical protein [Dokdonia sp.]|uniref:hypothetical protein n=1 Tax=Dokdonia sp. TaxID=2024995 RepID=UPI003265D8CE
MSQQQSASNLKAFIRTIYFLHYGIMLSLAVFSGYAIYSSRRLGSLSFTQQPMEFIIPLSLIGAIILGKFLTKLILNNNKKPKTLLQKLGLYQTTHLIRIATVEGVGLFAALTYLTTNNLFFLLIAGLAMILLIMMIPSKDKIERAITLTPEDEVHFRNPEKKFDS